MANILSFTKTIINLAKLDKQFHTDADLSTIYSHLYAKGDKLDLHFKVNLNQAAVDKASLLVNNFVEVSVREQLRDYIDNRVRPFVDEMMLDILAENIESGITQAGKTNDVLGFFNNPVLLSGNIYPISLAQALDTGSLYSALQLLDHYIANSGEFETLAPYVTVVRLQSWKSKIITFLAAS
jgi:hypothetical protein